ncbi:MAG: PorV/PorQ family protein [Candidatus Cloacimonadales bacterium]|jgi:hypothetical protein|nr:PorV/PorQ family protein [Candidatus Cloacimonadales bacterium]
MKFKRNIILIITLLLCMQLFATHKNAGTAGFQFLKMHYSARALGMANAFTAAKDDVDLVYFNPAGLAKRNSSAMKSNYINYVDDMNGGSFAFVMTYTEQMKAAIFAQYLNSGSMQRTIIADDGSYAFDGEFSASEMVIGVSLAQTVHEMLDLGVNVKYMLENLDDESASAAVIDLGLIHQTQNENLVIGASIRNIGLQLSYFTEEKIKEKMPTVLAIGANYTFNEKLCGSLDLVRPLDNDVYAKLGIEYEVVPIMSIRAGFDSRSSDYRAGGTFDAMSGLSAGFGIRYKRYILDYGVASMGDLGWNNQISIGYSL